MLLQLRKENGAAGRERVLRTPSRVLWSWRLSSVTQLCPRSSGWALRGCVSGCIRTQPGTPKTCFELLLLLLLL